jgi:hypothetical protein
VPVIALQERATVDDHVDLVGTRLDRLARLEDLHVGVRLSGGEAGCDTGHAD